MPDFVAINHLLVPINSIISVDITNMKEGQVKVLATINDTTHEHIITSEIQILELTWKLHPASLEGKYFLHWNKNAWWFHNIIGHPLMQILVWFGFTKLGLKVHDKTIPKPVSFR